MENKLTPETTYLREVTEPPAFGESARSRSRAEVRRESAQDVIAAGADETFGALFEVLGMTDISNPHRLDNDEIDVLATELLTVRAAQDIITGRADALKGYATEVINLAIEYDGRDSLTESGSLYSVENKVKLSKEVSGGKLNLDIDLLKTVLESDQFASITNEIGTNRTIKYPGGKTETTYTLEYELNEKELERQLKVGNIGMEQIIKAAIPGKNRTAFYVRSAK